MNPTCGIGLSSRCIEFPARKMPGVRRFQNSGKMRLSRKQFLFERVNTQTGFVKTLETDFMHAVLPSDKNVNFSGLNEQ
jgi:hypothetical protein